MGWCGRTQEESFANGHMVIRGRPARSDMQQSSQGAEQAPDWPVWRKVDESFWCCKGEIYKHCQISIVRGHRESMDIPRLHEAQKEGEMESNGGFSKLERKIGSWYQGWTMDH